MFNNQYNRHIANEVAKIDMRYSMDNELHGEGKKQQHKLGAVPMKEQMEMVHEAIPLVNVAPMKKGKGRPKKHMQMGSGDLSDMEGSGFFSDMWDGVKQGLSTAVDIAPDAINLARSMGYGKPKKMRGRPKKVGSGLSAGSLSAGSISGGSLSAGSKKYKKKKVSMMDENMMEGSAMSAGKKHGKKVVKEVKPVDGKISRKQRGEAVKAMMKKHGVSLGEASKMVSKHLKGGGFFDSLLKLAPLATLLI